jgi:hypothetical protein
MIDRSKNEYLYWVLRLLQDEGWSLWSGSDDLKTARILFEEEEIELEGEQKALVRVIELEKKGDKA